MHTSTNLRRTTTANGPAAGRRSGWANRLASDVLFVARRDRTWLLLPLLVLVLLMAALIVLGSTLGPLAPFVYPLF